MNIILDRFPKNKISFFRDYFADKGYVAKIIFVTYSNGEKTLDNSHEIYGDFEIASGLAVANIPWCLDDKFMSELAASECLFLTTLSRFVVFPGAWTLQDMSDHYYQLANFWVSCIETKNISHCVSYYIPHDPSSLSLYLVTKILKIPYIFIDCPHAARNIRFVSCSFTQRNLLIRSGSKNTPDWAFDIINKYIYELNQDFSNARPMFRKVVDAHLFSLDPLEKFVQLSKRIVLVGLKLIRISYNIDNLFEKIFNRLIPKPPIFFKLSANKWDAERLDKLIRLK